MLWIDPDEIPKHISNIMGSDSFIFKDAFVHSVHILVCDANHWTSKGVW
jgi:hypothetical protein